MTTPTYPRVGAKYFANRFLVHMFRSCPSLEFGPHAALLLTVVVLTEDKARYRRGVRFWNEQLCAYMHCRESRLISIRSALVESGWLHYRRGSNFTPGIYWVLVPGGDDCLNDAILGDNPESADDDKLPESAVEERDKLSESAVCPPVTNFPKAQFDCSHSEKVEASVGNKLRNGIVESAVESAVILPTTYFLNTEEEREPFEFVLKSGNTWALTPEKFAEYQVSFPGVDIEAELRAARQWILDNPTKRKTPAGMPRFLSGWLSRNRKGPSAPIATRQSGPDHRQAGLTQGSGRDWCRITPELLRSPSHVMAWFDSQTSIPDTDENRTWCLAIAKDASGLTIESPAALFVSLGKKLIQGQRSAPGDDSYDWAKTQMRLWRAHSQAKYAQQGEADPIQLRKASELTGAFV